MRSGMSGMGYRVARFSNSMVLSAQEEFVKRALRLLSGPKDRVRA